MKYSWMSVTSLNITKKKLSPQNLLSLKRMLNDFQYMCGTFLQDVSKDDPNTDSQIPKLVFCREYFSCCSPERYHIFPAKFTHSCVHCGQLSALLPDTPGFFPQCKCCETKALIKKIKWKQLIKLDLSSKKKTEKAIGYYIRYYIRYYICYSWVYILI